MLKPDYSPESPSCTYKAICEALDVSNVTVTAVRRAYLEGGVEDVLTRKNPERIHEYHLDGGREAYLIALASAV